MAWAHVCRSIDSSGLRLRPPFANTEVACTLGVVLVATVSPSALALNRALIIFSSGSVGDGGGGERGGGGMKPPQ